MVATLKARKTISVFTAFVPMSYMAFHVATFRNRNRHTISGLASFFIPTIQIAGTFVKSPSFSRDYTDALANQPLATFQGHKETRHTLGQASPCSAKVSIQPVGTA